ncbi:MAG: Hsp20/alpha crystallin family protein [Burkholderiales bacterium]|nr:MAG: Hsp20/alpha crystallin family protein [Betaproteobacteria bacterium]TAG28512.1 MAG: Hsp20/alpha crystallin family protein [Burkholderiales bacterium]
MTGLIRFHRSPLRTGPFAAAGSAGGMDTEQFFDNVAAQLFGDRAAKQSVREALRADVHETASAYVIAIDVPGIAKDQITVDVEEKLVRIEINAKAVEAEGCDTIHMAERATGTHNRAFRLPQAVDADAAVAVHELGVLTLTLPKKHAAAQKRLTIN